MQRLSFLAFCLEIKRERRQVLRPPPPRPAPAGFRLCRPARLDGHPRNQGDIDPARCRAGREGLGAESSGGSRVENAAVAIVTNPDVSAIA